ncbi:MAG: FHA domain-containing protein [Bacteroidota bacterium]
MTFLTLRWDHTGHDHERAIAQGESAVLGRAPENDLALPSEDRTIHRRHAEIVWDGGAPVLRVLGSNGVRLESVGRKLSKGETARIARTDRLKVGKSVLDAAITSAHAGERKLRCHQCELVQPYNPKGMCVRCGYALAGADTVFIRD